MTGFVTKKISRKRTLGSLFKAARAKLEWSLEQAEKETKICAKYLQALEEGSYELLPAEAYNIGYLRGYAQALKLDQQKVVSLYKEERATKRLNPQEDQVMLRPKRLGTWQFLITPKVLGIMGTVLLFGSMATYIVVQLRQFNQPPSLVISNVPKEFTSDKDTVSVQGKTAEGATVTMNAEQIVVKADGSFNQSIQLSPGVNEINVRSINRAEKTSQQTIKILYNQGLAKAGQSVTKE